MSDTVIAVVGGVVLLLVLMLVLDTIVERRHAIGQARRINELHQKCYALTKELCDAVAERDAKTRVVEDVRDLATEWGDSENNFYRGIGKQLRTIVVLGDYNTTNPGGEGPSA